MPTRLARKIGSYAIEKGIELNEAYALPPTETGTIPQAVSADWSLFSGNAPTYASGSGPVGGGGSWLFTMTNGDANGSRIRSINAATLATVNDRNFTAGCWVKFSQLPVGTSTSACAIMQMANIFTSGFSFYVAGATSAYGNNFSFSTISGTTVNSGVACNVNQWYFLSVIVNGTSTKYYVDGVETNSVTRTLSTNCTQLVLGSLNTANHNSIFNISNALIAPNTIVTATDLLEIYRVGASASIVKHYDGDSWEESYDQKVYNGTNWIQWSSIPAKYWNGSAWVAI